MDAIKVDTSGLKVKDLRILIRAENTGEDMEKALDLLNSVTPEVDTEELPLNSLTELMAAINASIVSGEESKN